MLLLSHNHTKGFIWLTEPKSPTFWFTGSVSDWRKQEVNQRARQHQLLEPVGAGFLLTHFSRDIPLDCSGEPINHFRTSWVSKRLQTRTLAFADFLYLSIHQKNLWDRTSLTLSRWLPRSPLQRENELYPPCCSQGRGGAAAASCKRGHSACQWLRSGEQLRCHCKSLLQFLSQYARECYSNRSPYWDGLWGSCDTSHAARLGLKYFHHLKASGLGAAPGLQSWKQVLWVNPSMGEQSFSVCRTWHLDCFFHTEKTCTYICESSTGSGYTQATIRFMVNFLFAGLVTKDSWVLRR